MDTNDEVNEFPRISRFILFYFLFHSFCLETQNSVKTEETEERMTLHRGNRLTIPIFVS